MGLRSAIAVAALVLIGAPPAAASPGVPCEYYGINAGAPVWQGAITLDATRAAALAATGARAVRIDFLVDDQPSWNETALARYDAIVDATLAAGLEPLGLMNYGALHEGQTQWNDDPDQDGYNPYVESFAEASKTLLQRFAGRIHRWEIWNEPNCWNDPSYASDPQNAGCSYILPRVYAKLLAEVYVRNEALLGQQDIHLVTGGLFAHDIGGSFSTASDYMAEVYAQSVWDWLETNKGRRHPWDFFGYHLYVEQGQTTDGQVLGQYLDDVRALATANQDSTPFLITEIGWNTDSVSDGVQTANLGSSFAALEQRSDVLRVYWFSYQDFPGGSWGLVHTDETAKPALAALQAAAAGCVASGGTGGTGGTSGGGGTSSGGSGGAGGTTSGGGSSGIGGGSGASGAGGTGGAGSGGGTGAGTGSGGTAGGGSADGGEDAGCGCRLTPRHDAAPAWLAAAVLAWAARSARTRRARKCSRLDLGSPGRPDHDRQRRPEPTEWTGEAGTGCPASGRVAGLCPGHFC